MIIARLKYKIISVIVIVELLHLRIVWAALQAFSVAAVYATSITNTYVNVNFSLENMFSCGFLSNRP